MGYKNPKELLDAATALPVAIEAKLPAGAPKISTKLLEFDNTIISKLPDFLFELPDLPALPKLPKMPGEAGLRRFITSANLIPRPSPGRGMLGEGPVGRVGSRGML